MSKATEAIEPESAGQSAEDRVDPKGLNMTYQRAAGEIASAVETGPDLGLEVDDECRQSTDESEIQWRRQPGAGRSTYPSLPPQRRLLRPFDEISIGSTRSLYESDLDYYVENNRRYVSDYWQPNDEDEQTRMKFMHQALVFLLQSQLSSVPLIEPTEILDIGTGTGDWVISIAEAFPGADVTGTDLSAIQPLAVPRNAFFEIFDAEDEDDWTYPQDHFDLVHFRNMAGSFNSWNKMYERAFAHLKPGGWIEVVDFDYQSNIMDNFFKESSEMCQWYTALGEAAVLSGKDVGAAHLDPERLSTFGFVDTKVTRHELPMGVWPEEPNSRSTAKLWLVACLAGFESVSLRLLTRYLGWEPDEVLRVCRNLEAAFKDLAMDEEKAKGLSVSLKILVGRKPILTRDGSQPEDELEAALEADDAQPEGKRLKMDSGDDRRRDLDLMPPAGSIATNEMDTEMTKPAGDDLEMRERL